MTTVLIPPIAEADDQATDSTPGCGCCIPPPGAGARDEVLAELQARREAVERRLSGIRPPA